MNCDGLDKFELRRLWVVMVELWVAILIIIFLFDLGKREKEKEKIIFKWVRDRVLRMT